MRANTTRKIAHDLKRELDHERYEHTIGVCYTAQALAMRYGYDLDKARLAGLLHDCAKCIPTEKKLKLCKKHDIPLSKAEQAHPTLVHAKLGAFLAKKEYGVTDPEILEAIKNHTTGKPNMGLLDKIIYVADYIEPHRCKAPRLEVVRRTAFVDLDKALVMILGDTLQYLQKSGMQIDPLTEETYQYYKNRNEHNTEVECDY